MKMKKRMNNMPWWMNTWLKRWNEDRRDNTMIKRKGEKKSFMQENRESKETGKEIN